MLTHPERAEPTTTTSLNIEHLLYGLIGLTAAVLRFGQLGRIPMTVTEAASAWRVWAHWQPSGAVDVSAADIVSPAYFSLTSLLTTFVGYSDAIMRLWPALAGLALVGAAVWLRPAVGRTGALVAAVLLATSPTLVQSSRMAGGGALALLAVMALVVLWTQPEERQIRWWLPVLGFGLATDLVFFSGLIALIVTYGLVRLTKPAGTGDLLPKFAFQTIHWITAAITFLATATLVTLNMRGIDWAASQLAHWVTETNWFVYPYRQLTDQLWTLGGLEGFGLFLGLIGTLVILVQRKTEQTWLAGFWIGSLLMVGLQIGEAHNNGLVVIASALTAGVAIQTLLERFRGVTDGSLEIALQVGGLLSLLLIVIAKNLGRYARLSLFDPSDVENLLLGGLCLLIGLVVWVVVLIWDRKIGLLAGAIVLLAAAIPFQWNFAWRISTWDAHDTRGIWQMSDEAVASEFPLLVKTVDESSRQVSGANQAPSFFSTVDHPLVRWYLRDYPQLTYGETLPLGASYDLLITPAAEEPAAGTDYIGTDFDYIVPRPEPTRALFLDQLRWVLFGENRVEASAETLTFWIRTDLLIEE